MAFSTDNPNWLALAPGWKLGFDAQQWIVYRGKKHIEPVAYVGSTKTTLLRILGEYGVKLDPTAEAVIGNMPEKFLDWVDR